MRVLLWLGGTVCVVLAVAMVLLWAAFQGATLG